MLLGLAVSAVGISRQCCQIGQIFPPSWAPVMLEKRALGGKSAKSGNTVSRAASSQTESSPSAHTLPLQAWFNR